MKRREGDADQARQSAVIKLGHAALFVVAAELRGVPADAAVDRPAGVADPVAQSGNEEER